MGGQSHKTGGGNSGSKTTGWGLDPICGVATLRIVKHTDETGGAKRTGALTAILYDTTQCALLYYSKAH